MKKNRDYYDSIPIIFLSKRTARIMRLSIFLSIMTVFQLFAAETYSQMTRLTLKLEDVKISDALTAIEKQSEFFFLYSPKLIDIEKKVNVNAENETIKDLLSNIFDGDVKFVVYDRQIILTPKEYSEALSSFQQGLVTGTVTNKNGAPLAGVNVVVTGTTQGTMTDIAGKYSIEVPQGSKSLKFSFIGMEPQEITIGTLTEINVTMVDIAVGLDEVVVIGYGTRSKRDVTTSISTISSEKIEKVVPSSPELLMQGKMSGVQIIGNQGQPNSRPVVRIRGTNTWGITDPLYVIDGIPIKEYGAGIEGLDNQYIRGYVNIMASIDPNDIESISVLKDASAGAIYGVRAANGVVLITTKKGKKGMPTINYSQRIGIQNVTKRLDLLNSKQYADYNNALYASDPSSIDSRRPENYVFDPSDPGYLGNSPTYDWQTAVREKNAVVQDYNLNISGGSEKVDYFVSFGYSNQEGVNIENQMKRYNGSFKLNADVTNFLRMGISYRLSTLSENNSFWKSPVDIAQMPPWQPIYDPVGINGYAQVLPGYDENGVWRATSLYGNRTGRNDLGYLSLRAQLLSSLRNMGTAYLEIEPLKELKLKGSLSIDYFNNNSNAFTDYLSFYFMPNGSDPASLGGPSSLGDYELRTIDNLNIVNEFTASYIKSFGNHNIDFLLNGMAQSYYVNTVGAYTTYVSTNDPDLAHLGGANEYTFTLGSRSRGALVGTLLRTEYNYANKYYVALTVRRDGSSRFAPENHWGVFPAASASWRISEERFMENLTWLNDLKIRAGWGKLGNQEVTDMAYLSPMTNRPPPYTWGNNSSNIGRGYPNTAAAIYGMANRSLQWETTTTENYGFDAVLFKKLNLSFEYYDKMTDGILQTMTLPPSTGLIIMPSGNVAKVQNRGFELNTSYSSNFGKLNFSVSANFTTVRNRVVELYGGIPMGNIEEGYSLFYIKGFQLEGRFKNDSEVNDWLATHEDRNYQTPKVKAGDFYFKDLRGAPGPDDKFYSSTPDGIVDDYDQVYIGKTIPGYFYGFDINLDYRGFDFNATFTGVGDVQKVNNIKQNLLNLNVEGGQHTVDALNYWTPTNTNTDLPRLIWGDPASNNRFSSFWVEDADYLRLANMQLGYTLPDIGIKDILKDLRFYVGCSNLFTITKFKGFDPEDEGSPAPIIMYFGLNARF